MAKTIVFESPLGEVVSAPQVGMEFEPGVPVVVTDAQAEILLEKYTNEYLEGTAEEVAKMKTPNGRAYRGTRNPNFGLQKNPAFKLVEDAKPDAVPYQAAKVVEPAPSVPSAPSTTA
jgi:hypothetical protein